MDYLSRLYEREIKDFFEVAKIKMTGTTKEGKKFGKLLGGIYLFLIFFIIYLENTHCNILGQFYNGLQLFTFCKMKVR